MAWYDNQADRDHCVGHWSKSLQAFLCWSEERAGRWARHRWHRVGDSPWLHHDTTSWCIAKLLVPPTLPGDANPEVRISLAVQIERAIESSRSPKAPYDCDFELARDRIHAVLTPHGFKLPRSERQADREGWGDGSFDGSEVNA